MLRVEHLKVGPLPALTFEVGDGRCLAVEGPSGSGKTRLLRAIADLDPTEGLVFLDGVERAEVPGPQWRRLVRYAAAEPAWWTPSPRGAFATGKSNGARGLPLLAALGLEAAHLDAPIATLSTGERHRLALARALVDSPKVLLADEPTAPLDAQSAARVESTLKAHMASGGILLLATHDLGLLGRLSDTRLLLGKRAPFTSEGQTA